VSEVASEATSAPRGNVVPFRVRLGRAAAVVAIPLTLAGAWLLAEPTGGETLLGSNPLWSSRPTAAQFAPRTVAPSLAVAPVEDVETASEFVRRTAWEGALTFDVVRGVPAKNGMRLDVPKTPVAAPADPEIEAAVAPAVESVPAALEAAPEASPEASPAPEPRPAPAPAPLEAAQEVRFMIVGGAFAVEENAQKLAQLLSREGFDTSLHFQTHNQLTVVSLGGYATEAEARKALNRARRQGQDKAWLKRL
jgi:cell division septation protein DedD